MQIFLIFYILVSLAEIFTVGGFLTNQTVLVVCFEKKNDLIFFPVERIVADGFGGGGV